MTYLKSILLFALIFILSIFINVLKAQQTMTLQTCMEVLAKNNLTYKESTLQTESSAAQLNQYQSQKLPQISISGGQNFNLGRSIDRFTNAYIDQFYNTSYLGLGFQMPVFQGFQIQNQIGQGKVLKEAASKNQESILNQQTIRLFQNYIAVLANQALYEASKQQVLSSKSQVERVQKQVDAGTVGQNALYEIKAQLSNDQFDEVTAHNNFKIARLQLFQLMNLMPDENIVFEPIASNSVASVESAANQIYEEAISFLPEIKSADFRLKSADYQIKAIKSANLPSIYLNGSFGAFYASSNKDLNYFQQLDATRNATVSLSLNIPILGKLQSKPRVDFAKVQQKIIENQKEITKQQIRQSVELVVEQLNANKERFVASTRQVENLKANFTAAESRLNAGTVSIFEYTLAKANLARAEGNNIRAKYELILQEKLLDFYKTGKF